MLGNKKNVFWEAFLIATVIFILGLLLGLFLESNRLQSVNDFYSQAEVSLLDSVALSHSIDSGTDCNNMVSATITFADNIYSEAQLLEKYEDSGKITDSIKIAHAKYDLLRTILWQNLITIKNKCPLTSVNTVVYLYEYNPSELNKKAQEDVWSKILQNLKAKEANNVILIPIAVNSNLASLDELVKRFNVTEFPAVIINDKEVLYNLQSTDDIEAYINSTNSKNMSAKQA